jgi:serine protease Do
MSNTVKKENYGMIESFVQQWAGRALILAFLATCFPVMFAYSARAADQGIENLRQTGKAFAQVAKKVSPAVVFIQVEKNVTDKISNEALPHIGPFGDEFFKRFFGAPFQGNPQDRQRPKRHVVGQGSGFIVSSNGYILTNNHVIGDADKVTVKLQDGREYSAKVIGTDPHSDVAVIRIDAQNLPVLSLGDSDTLEVGEWVVAVGNPFGLSHSLTAGIVSAKGRSNIGLADYENFIQTDAAINPGNSGGPLVNLDGMAVGMNTAIYSRSGGYMGIGFAIPINMIKSIKDQLISNGSVTRGYLGITIQNITPDLAKSFNLENRKGILIAQVSEDSPAEKAGLKQGDVIIAFNGKPVEQVGPFRNLVAMEAPGSKKTITVIRNGKSETFTIKIGKLPDSESQANDSSSHGVEELGLTVHSLTKDIAEQYGLDGERGVIVTHVESGSIAEMAGIGAGTLIQEVDRKTITTMDEFKRALDDAFQKGSVLMLIKKGQYSRYVALKVGG